MNQNGTSVSKLTNVVSDVLFVQNEQYPTSDTTFSSSNMLYINDSDNSPSTYINTISQPQVLLILLMLMELLEI